MSVCVSHQHTVSRVRSPLSHEKRGLVILNVDVGGENGNFCILSCTETNVLVSAITVHYSHRTFMSIWNKVTEELNPRR